MQTLGLRVSPKEVTFCIFNHTSDEIINIEELRIPNALDTPERLKYLRASLLDILREYNIEKAGIKLTESNARSMSIDRIQIEGVIQETFASSSLQAYYQGPLATVASKHSINKTQLKKHIKNEDDFVRIDDWCDFSEKEREAILVAIGAQNV